jgi:hypothetical protein
MTTKPAVIAEVTPAYATEAVIRGASKQMIVAQLISLASAADKSK